MSMKIGIASYVGTAKELRRWTTRKRIDKCTRKMRKRHINRHHYMWMAERGGGDAA